MLIGYPDRVTEVLRLIYEAIRLRKLIRRVVQDSIPSVAAHGSLTIAPKTWAEMFEVVSPELSAYHAALRDPTTREGLLPEDLEVAKALTRKPISEEAALAAAEKEIDKALEVMTRMEALARQRGWTEKWDTPYWVFLEELFGVTSTPKTP